MVVIELHGDFDSDAIAVAAVTAPIRAALDRVEEAGYGHSQHLPGTPSLAQLVEVLGYDPSDKIWDEAVAVQFIDKEWLPQG